MTKMTNIQFIDELCKRLGNDKFLLSDMFDQDDLFTMQDSIAQLIAEQANAGLGLAKHMVKQFPNSFQTEEV